VEIDEAEAGVAEVMLTATPSEPVPKAKLNQKKKEWQARNCLLEGP